MTGCRAPARVPVLQQLLHYRPATKPVAPVTQTGAAVTGILVEPIDQPESVDVWVLRQPIIPGMPLDVYRLANRANWDERVDIHFPSPEYGVDRFASDPTHLSDVVTFDKEKVGDVRGKRMIHLLCHIGTDTISWDRLGAEGTGIDLSEKSIAAARQLSDEAATSARFVVSELYDAPLVVPEKFDIVYTGVGAICWLPDIEGGDLRR